MAKKSSTIENLRRRRVPQFVGMYIAATWLVIELGDWVTVRFSLPSALTSYVFVAMLVMLPAVVLMSYHHGTPGKDHWTTTEKVVIPLNLLLALGVLYFLSPLLVVEAATETVKIPDETGTMQEFEVARQGYHKDVIGFFWRNESGDSDLDWLSYGLPLMLAHDLNRVSPVITVDTPFDSYAVRSELRNKGYPSFLNEPQGLRVEIARDRRSAALIVGDFSEENGIYTVNVTLVDAASARQIGSQTVSGTDWLTAVDELSVAVLNFLEIKPSDNQSDDPVRQHFSASLEAIERFTNGQIALDINNNYPLGILELQSAIEIDPEFAEASHALSVTHYLNNDIEAARETAAQALQNSYRLSETSKFILKTNRYIFDGDYERGERVVEIWTQVRPNSTEAFEAMAQINRFRGTTASLQKASAAYDRLIELDPRNFEIIREKAEIEQQRGDFVAAAGYLNKFLEHEPDSGEAHMQLANVYQALGDLEAAQSSLEDAAILSDSSLESEIGLARIEARRGFYQLAEARLEGQVVENLGPQRQAQVLTALAEVALVRGQVERTISIYAEIDKIAQAFMPPMIRLIRIQGEQATLLTLLGKTEEALEIADQIMAQIQPPIDAYMNFTYTTILEASGDRVAYRDRMDGTLQNNVQLPPILQPFVEMQLARLAIWDEEYDRAVSHTDRASELLGQSLIQVFQNDLNNSSLHVLIAELYLDADATEKSREYLQGVLKVFPANGHAKLVYAKVQMRLGDKEAARQLLAEALHIWADADANFVYAVESRSLMERL